MMRFKDFLTILVLLSGMAAAATILPDESTLRAMETITASDLESTVYFLASEEMQGRNTNTQANQIAASYIAHRFELLGLEPAGDSHSYFQNFPVWQTRLGDRNLLEIETAGNPLPLSVRQDYYPLHLSASVAVRAPLMFAGYGITAPDLGYDDYKEIDVRGKVVLVLEHEPGEKDSQSPFDGLLSSEHSRDYRKILNAQLHGAAGIIFLQDEANHTDTFARAAQAVWPEDASSGSVYSLKAWTDQIRIPAIRVSRSTSSVLFHEIKARPEEIQGRIDREFKTLGFPVQKADGSELYINLEVSLQREEVRIRNVLAYLPGSDKDLRDELVVVSAHFDHVGVRNGQIYFGADDDASGTAGVLELAEAYMLSSPKPRRSILFAAWNAEEKGLLGSYNYVAQPVFPLAKTIALFQMDMIGRNEEITDPQDQRFRGTERQAARDNINSVHILGYSRSEDLKKLAESSNQKVGLQLKFRYDNHEQNLLRRSDNWPFLVSGIPALFFNTGLHTDYHTPGDTADKLNYQKMEKVVRLVFLCSWNTANQQVRPRLNPTTSASEQK
ncbi:MAG: M28 family peptidase [Acidobacteria bacterium]|nr:M28 family peptidase [Acidobacteriota bacterium]